MSTDRRTLLLDGAKILAISLGLLFVAESCLRIAQPEKVLDIASDRQRIRDLAYRFDPEYLVALKPGAIKTYQRSHANGGQTIRWRVNKSSFRGRELRPDPGTRVIVYGDSNVQARFSALEDTFPARLERELTSLWGSDVEVVNAGLVGAGPDQALLRMAGDIERFAPDRIVLHVFADNDFGDIVRNRLFELDGDGALVRSGRPATLDPDLRSTRSRLLLPGAARDLAGRILRRILGPEPRPKRPEGSRAELLVGEILGDCEEEFRIYQERRPRAFSHFDDHYDMDLSLHPDSPAGREKVRLMEAVLAEAARVAEEKGVSLDVVIQPSSRDLTTNMLPNYTDLQRFPEYRRQRLSEIIDGICERLRIPRVNLYPLFLRSDPDSLYFIDDGHWNDAGQALAAREVAEQMRAESPRKG
jgi:hypothetical protein